MTRPVRILLVLVLGLMAILSACAIEPVSNEHAGMTGSANAPADPASHRHPMASLEDMPAEVRAAPARTQEAYRFAVANPEAARQIPCYCGCVGLGHDTSYDCYVVEADESGVLLFDQHAVNCTVCVDITQDQMRFMDGGVSMMMIRDFIDRNYAAYGPPTPMTGETDT